ncbi:MAG: NAD(P)-binding protein [Pseudomonadales bacterium]
MSADDVRSSGAPTRVAIIGGGCAAMTTAWELTQPHLGGAYEVTVYQQGWRLGGKGASGRGADGRIEEHGLHLWMGHYDNAFQLMRQCYAELDRDPQVCPLVHWTDAFKPDPTCGLMDLGPDGVWRRMIAHFPPFNGLPGDPVDESLPQTVTGYLVRSAGLLRSLLVSARAMLDQQDGSTDTAPPGTRDLLVRYATDLLKYGQLATFGGIVQGVAALESLLSVTPVFPRDLVGKLLDAVKAGANALLEPLLDGDAECRYLWEVIDTVLTGIRGTILFGLATDPRGFDAIDDYDTREWLALCGASERTLNSAFIRGLYDLAFAYEDGDYDRPRIAAGQGLRGGFRMFMAYRGALFWKMQGGMGDVVFAPLYEALKKRGVRFEFFRRLENVELSAPATLGADEQMHVTGLTFSVQARTRSGGEYQPLVDVKGLPCWPAAPLYEQLVDTPSLRSRQFEAITDRSSETEHLAVGEDFDLVVLGVSVGALPYVAKEILAHDQRWRDMVTHLKTVQTQCFQLWLNRGLDELGWPHPSANVSAFVEPFDSWADMSHLIAAEDWDEPPEAIVYFCNAMPTGPLPAEDDEAIHVTGNALARRNAVHFLNEDLVHMWPDAVRAPGEFDWSLLHAPGDASQGETRFDSQFWIANTNPSERYVLCLPGTPRYRISPLDRTYDNLTIAGDWTECGFNFGCVEGAVMSGRLAAHACSLSPPLEAIFAYDHP